MAARKIDHLPEDLKMAIRHGEELQERKKALFRRRNIDEAAIQAHLQSQGPDANQAADTPGSGEFDQSNLEINIKALQNRV